jgi:hypothetical protein
VGRTTYSGVIAAMLSLTIACSAPQPGVAKAHATIGSPVPGVADVGRPAPNPDVLVRWGGTNVDGALQFEPGEIPTVTVSFTNTAGTSRSWDYDLFILPSDRVIGPDPRASNFSDVVWDMKQATTNQSTVTLGPRQRQDIVVQWLRTDEHGRTVSPGKYVTVLPVWVSGHLILVNTGFVRLK